MKRPLTVFGITLTLTALMLLKCGFKAAVPLCLIAAAVFIVWLIPHFGLKKYIFLPTISVCILFGILLCGLNSIKEARLKAQIENENAVFSGTVTKTPEHTASGIVLCVRTDLINGENKKVTISYYTDAKNEYKLYDYISVDDALITMKTEPGKKADSVLFSASSKSAARVLWEAKRTPYYYLCRLKETVNEKADIYLGSPEAGIFKGMLFGGSDDIPDETLNDFRASGVAHLLAVSGLHTALWCSLLLALFTFLGVPKKVGDLICILFLVCFCLVSGLTPSVLRASFMMLLVLLAPFFKRQSDPLNSVGFAMTLLVILNPYNAVSPSFLLSAAATLGVLAAAYCETKLRASTDKIRIPLVRRAVRYILSSAVISLFASLFTLPVSAAFFGTFSTLSVATNLLAVKPAFWALITGTAAAATSFVPFSAFDFSAVILFKLCTALLKCVEAVTAFIAAIPYSCIPVSVGSVAGAMLLSGALILGGIYASKHKHNKNGLRLSAASAAAIFVISLSVNLFSVPASTRISVLSVGNGLAVVLRSGTHYAVIGTGAETGTLYKSLYDTMPSLSCTKTDAVFIPSMSEGAEDIISKLDLNFEPQRFFISEYAYKALLKNDSVPENTIVDNDAAFDFIGKIHIEVIDTYRMYCVIISNENKTAVISLYDGNDLEKITASYGVPDIFITKAPLPENFGGLLNTLIISSGNDILPEVSGKATERHCKKLYLTALDGTITLPM